MSQNHAVRIIFVDVSEMLRVVEAPTSTELEGPDLATDLCVRSARDREGGRVTDLSMLTYSATRSQGAIQSKLPARGADGLGIRHIAVNNASPASCASTGELSTVAVAIAAALAQLGIYISQLLCSLSFNCRKPFFGGF